MTETSDSDPTEGKVFYSLADIPDSLREIDEAEFLVKWETVFSPEEADRAVTLGMDELTLLFHRKAAAIIKEKKGICAHVKHEKISRTTSYAHSSSILTGEYRLVIYGKKD